MAGSPKPSSRWTRTGALALVVFLPGNAGGQEPMASDSQSDALLELQTASDPIRRMEAVAALGSVGSPVAIQALATTLSEDPNPSVRGASALALGRLGPLARQAVPELMQGLEDQGPLEPSLKATVCTAAAGALGEMGRTGMEALPALARAGVRGCGGDPSAPLAAITAMAREVGRVSASLTSEELSGVLEAFQEAQGILGSGFPPEATESLGQARRELGARRLGWLAPAASAALAAGGALLSLLRRISGLLAALLLVGLVVLLLRNAGRILPRLPFRLGGGVWRGKTTPAVRRGVATEERRTGESLATQDDRGTRETVKGSGTRETGEESDGPPKGSRIDILLGEIRTRARPQPGAPSSEEAERALQAVAWILMTEGRLEGWVELDQLPEHQAEEEGLAVMAYLQNPLGMAELDRSGSRIRLTLAPEDTAQMGSLHLLREMRPGPNEILSHLGSLHDAVARGRGRRGRAEFLRMAAAALLDAADALEGGAQALGIAEEALTALAGSGRRRNRGRLPRGRGDVGGEAVGSGLAPGPGGTSSPEAAVRLRRLKDRLHSEAHPGVRERIITAIGGMGPDAGTAVPLLLGAVEREPPAVALAALESLGRIGPGAGKAVPLLLETLEKGRPSHQLAATRALGRMGEAGEAAAPTLLRWISKDGVPHELRAGAAEALGGMPGQANSAVPPLLELLRSPVATDVRAAAALALARLDPGWKEVEEALTRTREVPDGSLRGMVSVAILVREERLGKSGRRGEPVAPAQWLVPMAATGSALALLQLGAVVGTEVLSPGTILPALYVGPVMAFLGGIVYGVATRRLPQHPALGSGATGWGGASLGLLLGFTVSGALTPVALVIGGGLALGSGAFGGTLVHTALSEL